MNAGKFFINDFQIVSTVTISSFAVSVSNIVLFKSVTLDVRLFNANNNLVNAFPLTLVGDDYAKWGGDDTYLYQYVANKMGYSVLSNIVPDVPVVVVPDVPVVVVPDVPVVDSV
jgi:hypothetical protein